MTPLLAFLLVPVASYLNHLGGQSTTIPYPRVVCRMLGIGTAFWLAAIATGMPADIFLLVAAIAGHSFWAAFKWGPGFMALAGVPEDLRNYTTNKLTAHYWVAKLADLLTGIKPSDVLLKHEKTAWGTCYMCIRGGFLYIFFIYLAVVLTPWALLFGLPCFMQGFIYQSCATVSKAEYIVGALLIGLPEAGTIIMHLSGN